MQREVGKPGLYFLRTLGSGRVFLKVSQAQGGVEAQICMWSDGLAQVCPNSPWQLWLSRVSQPGIIGDIQSHFCSL